MVNGLFAFCLRARDFGRQCRETGVEFGDRQRVEVVAGEEPERVAGAGSVVGIHEAKLALRPRAVNGAHARNLSQ